MNKGLEKFVPADIAVDAAKPPDGVGPGQRVPSTKASTYTLLNVLGSTTIPEGKYLLNPQTGKVEMQWVPGHRQRRRRRPRRPA